jgi:arginase
MGSRALVGVPLYTLAKYGGMGAAPAALRKAGLARSLEVTDDLGDVPIRLLESDVVEGKMKNFSQFKDSSLAVYRAARAVKADNLVVLGGECSETVGVMAGLTERFGGRPGMLWMDAHGDFNTPETSPSGYIGGMCLAMATGRGPRLGLGPKEAPVEDERLVHVGSRALDPPEAQAFDSSSATLITAQQARKDAVSIARDAAKLLDGNSDWIACHLDVDIVDPKFIPAVNYPTPGGLTPDEASILIGSVLKTGKVRLLEVAAYNGSLDPRGASLQKIAGLLERAFHEAGERQG